MSTRPKTGTASAAGRTARPGSNPNEWRRALGQNESLPSRAKSVGIWLSDFSDHKTGERAHPSLETLTKCTGLARTTVKAALRELREAGWIEMVQRGTSAGRGGGGLASEYRLLLQKSGQNPDRITEGSEEIGSESDEIGSESDEIGSDSVPPPSLYPSVTLPPSPRAPNRPDPAEHLEGRGKECPADLMEIVMAHKIRGVTPARASAIVRRIEADPETRSTTARLKNSGAVQAALHDVELDEAREKSAQVSRAAKEQARLRALEIQRCTQCDPNGYLPNGRTCDHREIDEEARSAGIQLVRDEIKRNSQPAATTQGAIHGHVR